MTHPALALLRCGSIPDALACLRERDDHPAALALLEAGFTDYAETLLAKCARTPVEAVPGTPCATAVPARGEKAASEAPGAGKRQVGRAA